MLLYAFGETMKKDKITKEEIRNIKAGVRRNTDIENGIGLNRHLSVAKDKRKEANKKQCRKNYNNNE